MRVEKINIRLAAILENFRYQTRQGYTDDSRDPGDAES